MKLKIKTMLIEIAIPTLCFVLLGLLFIGDFIIQPDNSLFFFTIYGLSAILFYNLIIHFGIRSFVLLGILFSLLMLLIFKPTTNILVNLRNINWFILIGILSYIISQFEKKGWHKSSMMLTVTSWFVGFILLYVIMALLNIYVYNFYKIGGEVGLFFYLRQSIKLGGVLGIGIGFGELITQSMKQSSAKK